MTMATRVRNGGWRLPPALALGFAVVAAPATAVAADPAGAVVSLRGQASAFARSDRRALSPAASVFLEDTVATAEQSRVEIRLGADTTLRLGEKGRVKIARVAAAGTTLDLEEGALVVDKAPESRARSLDIESSFGRIAVRGTSFFAGPSRGVFGVAVLRGHVTVEAAGRSVELREGEGTDIARPGDPPSPVKTWAPARLAEALAQVE
ncbi:MAG: FecR family protein [Siculibacillus sp.]|nr:FecR family protein [Siculibacillus sp.]